MPIELSFQDEKLRKICESSVSAKRKIGELAASALFSRLADLHAAQSPRELVDMGLARYDERSKTRIVIELADDYFVLASVNHRREPKLQNGELDWTQVSRLKVLSIERSNES